MRKALSTDFTSLKAKVKAEMLRRNQSGSVAGYGGSAYDFSAVPSADGPILGEHLKKNLEPMQAVNPDGLPEYPGELTETAQEAMETKIAAWGARSMTDRSASDCKSGCTGTCYTGCATGCYTGCTGTCSGTCDGCSGCGSGCATGCSGCGSGCASSCSGDCEGGCRGCGSGCANGCQGCGSGCADECDFTCLDTCENTCPETCNTTCTETCADACWTTGMDY